MPWRSEVHSIFFNKALDLLATKMLRKGLAVMAMLVIAVTGGGVYIFNLVMSDNLNFRQGDFAHAIVVRSKTIRTFPNFDVIRDGVHFTYSAGDGTAPEQITIRYDSSESVDDLTQKYQAYCEGKGYPIIPEDKHLLRSRLACDAPDYRIEIDFQLPRYDATSVNVVFLEQRS